MSSFSDTTRCPVCCEETLQTYSENKPYHQVNGDCYSC